MLRTEPTARFARTVCGQTLQGPNDSVQRKLQRSRSSKQANPLISPGRVIHVSPEFSRIFSISGTRLWLMYPETDESAPVFYFIVERMLFGTFAATLYFASTSSVMSYFSVDANRIATSLSFRLYCFLIHVAS